MDTKDLKTLTLNTPVYHPFFGEGFALKIELKSIKIDFPSSGHIIFSESGMVGMDNLLKHLFLHPVKIVKI